jgi:hypothetical protein
MEQRERERERERERGGDEKVTRTHTVKPCHPRGCVTKTISMCVSVRSSTAASTDMKKFLLHGTGCGKTNALCVRKCALRPTKRTTTNQAHYNLVRYDQMHYD